MKRQFHVVQPNTLYDLRAHSRGGAQERLSNGWDRELVNERKAPTSRSWNAAYHPRRGGRAVSAVPFRF